MRPRSVNAKTKNKIEIVKWIKMMGSDLENKRLVHVQGEVLSDHLGTFQKNSRQITVNEKRQTINKLSKSMKPTYISCLVSNFFSKCQLPLIKNLENAMYCDYEEASFCFSFSFQHFYS